MEKNSWPLRHDSPEDLIDSLFGLFDDLVDQFDDFLLVFTFIALLLE
jgi:hypothetical protein